jgi:uncharacterized Zn finger protein
MDETVCPECGSSDIDLVISGSIDAACMECGFVGDWEDFAPDDNDEPLKEGD